MPLITIDSKGDIVLELGKERLLVSSKALTLASPVFEAMFKPTFKEGIQSHQNSCDPSIIPLPEDDAEAFILLCKVVHHRAHEIPQEPGIPCLENLAFICDKYQCSAAVAYHGIVWLQRLLRDAGAKDLNRLLLLAYVLDLPDCFSSISWEILQTHTGQFVDLPLLADHPLIRHDFLCTGK